MLRAQEPAEKVNWIGAKASLQLAEASSGMLILRKYSPSPVG
jgi:hypothetical protein